MESNPQLQSLQSSRMLWITDPWNTLSHNQDTTLRLIQEASRLGIQTFWSSSDLVLNTKSPDTLNVFPCVAPFNIIVAPNEYSAAIELKPSTLDLIHYRVDPPVDFNYISLIDAILARDPKAPIMSPPAILKHQSEKLPPVELAAFTPRLAAIYAAKNVATAYQLFKDDAVVVTKPLNEAQSKGVKKMSVPASFLEFEAMVGELTAGFSSPIVMQEFLPQVDQGEVRMWFANGKFIAALKKYPKAGDFRVLIDEGSKVEAYELSTNEHVIAEAVGAVLKKQGVMLAAVDLIGGKISDYNITSPGLLVQLEKVHGRGLAGEILKNLTSPVV